jgi:hypothetical protein
LLDCAVFVPTRTPTKTFPQPQRPASTPPRIQTAASNKHPRSKRKLLEQASSSIASKETHTACCSEDALWNQFLLSEIKKNEKKSELLDFQIQMLKAEVQKSTQSEAL